MTADEVKEWLDANGRTALWLAEAAGYKPTTIYNAISQNRFTEKLERAIRRAFGEEERRREVDLTKPDASVWDLVYFNGHEAAKIDRAKKFGGYDGLPALYRDAVIHFADLLLEREAQEAGRRHALVPVEPGERHWTDLRGGVAAGAPIIGHVVEEPIPVGKEYPEDHYALRVFGASMEPKIPDGSTIIVRVWPAEKGVPRKGTIVVYSDASGSTLKEFGYRKAKAGEEHDAMGNVPVLRSLNKAFPDVQTMDGGRIDAVLVEVL